MLIISRLITGLFVVAGMMTGHGHAVKLHAPRVRCAVAIVGQQTQTGHEADAPMRVCGHWPPGYKPGMCYVTPWGPLTAHAAVLCDGRHKGYVA